MLCQVARTEPIKNFYASIKLHQISPIKHCKISMEISKLRAYTINNNQLTNT